MIYNDQTRARFQAAKRTLERAGYRFVLTVSNGPTHGDMYLSEAGRFLLNEETIDDALVMEDK